MCEKSYESLNIVFARRTRHVPYVSHVVGVGFDTVWCLSVPEERDTALLGMAFLAVEHQTLSVCLCHHIDEIFVMVFLVLPENHNAIGYGYNTCQAINMLIHPALEYVLGHIQSER